MDLELDSCASLFMNIATGADHSLQIVEPVTRPGDYIDLRAEVPLLVAVSACPQEDNPCNAFQPSRIGLRVHQRSAATPAS